MLSNKLSLKFPEKIMNAHAKRNHFYENAWYARCILGNGDIKTYMGGLLKNRAVLNASTKPLTWMALGLLFDDNIEGHKPT
jgi:hypothetical protein